MGTKKDTITTSSTTRKGGWDPLAHSKEHHFGVQSKPPLALRQFLRSTISVNPHGLHWKPSGFYNPPYIEDKTSPEVPDELPKIIKKSDKSSPTWRPPGPMRYKRPPSPSSEKRDESPESKKNTNESKQNTNLSLRCRKPQKRVTPWYPSGILDHEEVPYFDAPSLRWSPQQIKKTMPEFKSKLSRK